jgi:hypothetical protein
MLCTACKTPLEPVFPSDNGPYQFNNALWLGFFGGYGMFIDPEPASAEGVLGGADREAVLCHECAHALCTAFPWAQALLAPELSHSHRTAFWEAHPDHEGWDRPSALTGVPREEHVLALQQTQKEFEEREAAK